MAHGDLASGIGRVIAAAGALVSLAGPALAQEAPSPFAGSWRGTIVNVEQVACGGTTTTYAFTMPWSGTVSLTGEFQGVWGAASATRDGVPYATPPQPSGYPAWYVRPDGTTDYIYGDHEANGAVNCDLSARYSAPPSLSMSGDQSCPAQAFVDPGTGQSCTNTIHLSVTGTGTATAFPMVVNSNIGATVSSASASIQYRPQDVGASGSVYTFAVAPQTLVKASHGEDGSLFVGFAKSTAGGKDTSVACVLAQLNASGQLQSVSASSLQAYVTGVLSSQGQAVTIINNVPTVNIGGAVFYVGYGSSASAMLNGNIVNRAVSVPGSTQCDPQPPQAGWWWNPNESGRGYSIEAQGNNLFMASYLYDASGRATWHVAAGPTMLEGSLFTGSLLAFGSGVTLDGPYRSNAPLASPGSVTLAFSDARHGTLVWPGGTVAIQRFPVSPAGASATPLANAPQNGWWWGGSADNGRGFFFEWQGNAAFLAGYMYDTSGNAVWYVSQGTVSNALSYQGTWLQFANGQTLTGAYKAPALVNGNVAPVTITFQGADTGILTLPSGNLAIQRFRF